MQRIVFVVLLALACLPTQVAAQMSKLDIQLKARADEFKAVADAAFKASNGKYEEASKARGDFFDQIADISSRYNKVKAGMKPEEKTAIETLLLSCARLYNAQDKALAKPSKDLPEGGQVFQILTKAVVLRAQGDKDYDAKAWQSARISYGSSGSNSGIAMQTLNGLLKDLKSKSDGLATASSIIKDYEKCGCDDPCPPPETPDDFKVEIVDPLAIEADTSYTIATMALAISKDAQDNQVVASTTLRIALEIAHLLYLPNEQYDQAIELLDEADAELLFSEAFLEAIQASMDEADAFSFLGDIAYADENYELAYDLYSLGLGISNSALESNVAISNAIGTAQSNIDQASLLLFFVVTAPPPP